MSHEIYIFGSAVRGEICANSDIDILVIPALGQSPDCFPATWSIYTRPTLEGYYADGRLFAWHLYLESRNIYCEFGQPLLKLLGPPAPYRTAKQDIENLYTLFVDACQQLSRGTSSPVYELGLTYTAIRDIAMAASWALLTRPCFSRRAPYLLPIACPLPEGVYDVAMAARHASTRGAPVPNGIEYAAKVMIDGELVEWVNSIRGLV